MTSKYRSLAQTVLLTHSFHCLLDISMAMSNRHPHTGIGVNRVLNVLSQILPATLYCSSSFPEAGSATNQLPKQQTIGPSLISPLPSCAMSNLLAGPASHTPKI